MANSPTLPRETNPARVLSVLSRSLRLARTARTVAKANPHNVGATARRADRTLAAWAQSRRVRFVRVYGNVALRGAARTSAVRKAARQYREALKVWARHYDTTNGWSAVRRLVK
jgi:hypothetical protein